MTTRRELLKAMAAGAVTLTLWPRAAWSSPAASAQPLLLVVMLRGGLDGLHAVPPMGDNAWGALRGSLPFAPGDNNARPLPIDRDFALHPSLSYAAQLYRQKAFMPVVAIAPPYQGRSHFEAQDCVENGSSRPSGAQDGWMNRCVASLHGEEGLAIATAMPLIMRAPAKISTWSPPLPTGVDPNLLQRLDTLYAEDPMLAEAWSRAVAESHDDATMDVDTAMTGSTPNAATMDKASGKALVNPNKAQAAYSGGLPAMLAAAGKFMARDGGPQIAFVEDTGWDTHAAEVATLQRKLGQLDAGLKNYHEAMGAAWDRTVVVVVTEFGRTAMVNGTGGTDHGTGGVSFLAGGAIAGGRIAGQWPGLSSQDLNEGRDVHATTDMRALFKGILADHLQMPTSVLDTRVFPDSAAVRPMGGLLRSARAVAAA
ncbi:MAG TPA: DUF1501 domain-containing protein [Xanthomonadaceae bacterium]|nr:DUF1501 domain-containing protein [Xanthomonadaceae bacterium]